jgi:hypothetical protein
MEALGNGWSEAALGALAVLLDEVLCFVVDLLPPVDIGRYPPPPLPLLSCSSLTAAPTLILPPPRICCQDVFEAQVQEKGIQADVVCCMQHLQASWLSSNSEILHTCHFKVVNVCNTLIFIRI